MGWTRYTERVSRGPMAEPRPAHFPPGTPIGKHYTIEGLVRLAERRMYYLANDLRPEVETRRCWACGHTKTPRKRSACDACEQVFEDRRFLLSLRWQEGEFLAYEAFSQLGLDHPGLATPVDVFRHGPSLVSVIPYNGEGLMLDEASPLSNGRVLELAQRLAGTLAFLHINGVRLADMSATNLLISPDNAIRLFDLNVHSVMSSPLPREQRGAELRLLGTVLRRYCNVEAEPMAQFLATVESGNYPTPNEFGRAVEKRFEAFSHINYAPNLSALSDVGLTRQLNEDNWGWRKLSNRAVLYAVADGMGGHDGGEVASQLAVQTICDIARQRETHAPPTGDAVENLLDEAFQAANNTIKDHAEQNGNDMGTTLVSMLLLENKTAFIANVGDSRAYMLRGRSLHQVTKDHSLVAKMVERGRITEEEARNHPHSNILLRTVGTERDVDIDVFRVDVQSGDKIMMCSDGLWGEVEDQELESIMNTYMDPRIAARELVRAAHHGGGKDNVTLMIVEIP
jgi:serine/threonine protein phosphatase PrpC